MKYLPLLALVGVFLSGCLTTPVSRSGGAGAHTVMNSNPAAIVSAAQSVFANSGYTSGPSNFPDSISFDKPGGAFGQLMWGSYDQSTTVRARMNMDAIPGTNNYRLSVKVFAVNDAGDPGFEEGRPLLGGWQLQFDPLLTKIAQQAGGAGGM